MSNARSKQIRRLILCGFLGLLFAFGLPIVQTLAQSPSLDRAQSLSAQGQQQFEQGNLQTAIDQWQQAEQIYRQLGQEQGTIGTRLNQATAWQNLGFHRRAKSLLEPTIAALQSQPASLLKAKALLEYGSILRLLGEVTESQQVLSASLAIAQQLRSTPAIQAAHLQIGNTLLVQRQFPEALQEFQQVTDPGPLRISAQLRQLKLLQQLDRPTEFAALAPEIAAQLEKLPPSHLAVYGRIELAALLMVKNPENNAQMRSAQLLAAAIEQSKSLGNLRAQSYAIGRLGNLYEQTQQWSIAKQLTQEALQLAKRADVPEILYQWQWQNGRILKNQGEVDQAKLAYTQAVDTLQSLRQDLTAIDQDVQFSFRDRVEPVYRELVDLLLAPDAPQTDLRKARQVIEALQLAELNNFFREACLTATAKPIDNLDPTAAVLYPVILADRLEVILSLPGQPLRHYATALPRADIEAGIRKMRSSLRSTAFEPEWLAATQKLYGWLVQPIAADLAAQKIKTLVFVLDGSLRNVPMAALHDGNQYLIEQYQIALAPSLQLLNPRSLRREQIRALVGGLSQSVDGTAPLPGVQQELSEISRQVSAQVLLDRSFTTQGLQAQVQAVPFTIVHLATHGQFSSNAQETYLQTWDGRLAVNQLQMLLAQRSTSEAAPIELLVLSACETAKGDSRAALGMAGVAVRSGARSTLATLWSVNDASTATLIAAFYQALAQPEMGKAQAVRAAQLTLIRSPEFNHPYHWAPFILIGSWL